MAEALGLIAAGLLVGMLVPPAVGAGGRAQAVGAGVGVGVLLPLGLALPGAFWGYLVATVASAALVALAARVARPR